jgi:hypothetical protein
LIVVDGGVIAHLVLGGSLAAAAEALLRADPEWVSPVAWRTDLATILALHIRAGRATAEDGVALVERVAALLCLEPRTDPRDVLELSLVSSCPVRSCEYVSAAMMLGVPLVTTDDGIADRFPGIATALA